MANASILVRKVVRLRNRSCTTFYRLVKRLIGVLDIKRNIANPVAMLLDMLRRWMLRRKRRRQDEIDIRLPHQIARHLTITRFQPGIPGPRETKRLSVIKLRLLCITDVKLNVMYLL